MKSQRQIVRMTAWLALLFLFTWSRLHAQSHEAGGPPSLVEVYWKSSRSVVIPGITNVIVLDPDIARAETGYDTVQVYGLERGETVVLGYMAGSPVSIRLRVIERPQTVISPSLLRRQAGMAQGSFSSTAQISNAGGATTVAFLNGFSWSQLVGSNGRFDFASDVEDDSFASGHTFNVRHASALYHKPGLDVRAFDFNVSLVDGGSPNYLSTYSFTDSVQLRGGSVTAQQGQNLYTFFGGTTIPYYYLTLGSTRDVAGFSFHRDQTEHLGLFATSSFINAPQDFLGLNSPRLNNYMQTAGLAFRPNRNWAFQATGGASNRGGLLRGELAYHGRRTTAFGAASTSSALFPLNQVESLFSGATSAKAGWVFRHNESITESVYYQHNVTKNIGGLVHAGSSDYVSPGLGMRLNRRESMNLTYTFSHNTGGFTNQPSTGNRFDATLNSQFTPQVSNSAQVSAGSVQDPLQLNSEDQFAFRDGFSFPVKHGNMMAGFNYERSSPSLVQKLNQELNLLSLALQPLFLQNPVSFVESGNLPPEVRAILDSQHPSNVSLYASGQFHLGRKLTLNPNFSFARITNGKQESWTPFAGYGLIYQVRPSLQLTSSLVNVWVLTQPQAVAQRTTVLSVGFRKTFYAAPSLMYTGHHGRVIEGRVFRDNNVNGVFSAGDKGLPGIQVKLDTGELAMTDELGRYKFSGVSADEHLLSIDLAQFRGPVRMTTRNQLKVDVIRDRIAVANFGVVNFARLMGNVFNDLRLEGRRQPDAKGLPEIRLVLNTADRSQSRVITTGGTGDYEADDVPPGDYTLTVDAGSMPANYALSSESFPIHVSPVSTVVQDVPARALRSISGRVFLKVLADKSAPLAEPGRLKIGGVPQTPASGQRGAQAGGRRGQAAGHQNDTGANGPVEGEYTLVPLAGVQLTAGYGVAKSDENGDFLLRDLPAGEVIITLAPLETLPEGMKVPGGAVRLPADPIQVQGATIVISNPDLVPYLIGKTAGQVRDAAKMSGRGTR